MICKICLNYTPNIYAQCPLCEPYFSCLHCGYTANTYTDLCKNCRNKIEHLFKCNVCESWFVPIQAKIKHTVLLHGEKINASSRPTTSQDKSTSILQTPQLQESKHDGKNNNKDNKDSKDVEQVKHVTVVEQPQQENKQIKTKKQKHSDYTYYTYGWWYKL